jgi:hypothetical protein
MSDHDGVFQWGHDVLRVPWTEMPTEVLRDSNLDAGPRLLYAILCSFMYRGRDIAYPSKKTLSDYCGVSERQVRTYQTALVEEGLLTIEERPGETNIYRLWVKSQGRKHSSGEGGSTVPPPPRKHSSAEEDVRTEDVQRKTYDNDSSEETSDRAQQTHLELNMEDTSKLTPSQAKWRARLQARLATFPPDQRRLVCQYLEIAEDDPRAHAATDQGKCSRVDALQDLLEEHGEEAWRYGLEQCRSIGKAGDGYIKTIIENYDPTKTRNDASPGASRSGSTTKYHSPKEPDAPEETQRGWDAVLGDSR